MLNFIYAKYSSKNKLDWPKTSFVNLKTFNYLISMLCLIVIISFLMKLTNLLFQLYFVLIVYIIVTRNLVVDVCDHIKHMCHIYILSILS